jgi:hypothetical protein
VKEDDHPVSAKQEEAASEVATRPGVFFFFYPLALDIPQQEEENKVSSEKSQVEIEATKIAASSSSEESQLVGAPMFLENDPFGVRLETAISSSEAMNAGLNHVEETDNSRGQDATPQVEIETVQPESTISTNAVVVEYHELSPGEYRDPEEYFSTLDEAAEAVVDENFQIL